MAVAFDSYFEDGIAGDTSISFVSNTANVPGSVAANSNRVLVAALVVRSSATAHAVSVNTVDMGAAVGTASTGGNGHISIFKMINPPTGNLTMAGSWTGTSAATLHVWSWYNADQTTGVQNFNSHTATDTALTVAITSTSGNAVCVAAYDDDAASGTFSAGGASFISDARDGRFSGNYHGAHALSNGSTITMTGTLGSSVLHIEAGVDVIAVAAGDPDQHNPFTKILFKAA